ncbi:MAG: ATP-binding cassette domain-containing protein [Acholeplasmataceae bacterium]|jgi:oligopeptide transport system ATP-binding protein|nr:ATP-binding cassette domain-containing protein [Acholeplasmataceae bacterium]
MTTKEPIIQVKDLAVSFRTNQGLVRAVRGVNFELYKGETLAIVGESGSGKSVSSRSIMGILAGNAIVDGGEIIYENQDLLKIDEEDFHKIRGNKLGMIFQDPTSSLNPIMRVGKQITEAMILNGKRKKNKFKDLYHDKEVDVINARIDLEEVEADDSLSKAEKSERIRAKKLVLKEAQKALKARMKTAKVEIEAEYAVYKQDYKAKKKELFNTYFKGDKKGDVLEFRAKRAELHDTYMRKIKVTQTEARDEAYKIMHEVGIPEPEKRFKMYPFQFSGGMKQRIVIAIALMAQPEVLICDEPTTALDVTIQAQILDLIKKIKEDRHLSVIFITHNLGVVANVADRVAVMYAGKIVEYGTLDEVFYDPRHPYTWALMSSMPDINSKEKLQTISGTPPNMLYPPKGDAFAQRNPHAMKIDFEEQPPLFKISDSHFAATWLLHPDAPKVLRPTVIDDRIAAMKEEVKRLRGEKE